MREKGEITIPKELRDQYRLSPQSKIKLIPRVDGILIKPRVEDPVGLLKGTAKEVWPTGMSSIEIVKSVRRTIEIEETK